LPARVRALRRVLVAARFAVFVAGLRVVRALSTSSLARTVGTVVRTKLAAAFASDSTDDRTVLRASRANAFARFIDVPMLRLTTPIARDSTTVPSLTSERNIAAASRSAH